jgi:biopolymer transport protein ExbD
MRTAVIASVALVAACLGGGVQAKPHCAIHATIHADDTVEFDGSRIHDPRLLGQLLLQYMKQNPDCELQVTSEKGVSYRTFVQFLDAFRTAGTAKVGIITEH